MRNPPRNNPHTIPQPEGTQPSGFSFALFSGPPGYSPPPAPHGFAGHTPPTSSPDPPHHTFSPPFSFAFLFPDASSPGAPSAAFFAIAPIGCPLSAGSPDMGLCFSRRSLRTSHSPCLPGHICMHSAFPILRQFIEHTSALPSPVLSACQRPAPANPRTRKKTADVSDIRCFSVVIQIRIRRAASRIQSGRT